MSYIIVLVIGALAVVGAVVYFAVKRPEQLANAEAKVREAEAKAEDAISKFKK